MNSYFSFLPVRAEATQFLALLPDPTPQAWAGFLATMGILLGSALILSGICLHYRRSHHSKWLMRWGAIVIMLSFFVPVVALANWRAAIVLILTTALTSVGYYAFKRVSK